MSEARKMIPQQIDLQLGPRVSDALSPLAPYCSHTQCYRHSSESKSIAMFARLFVDLLCRLADDCTSKEEPWANIMSVLDMHNTGIFLIRWQSLCTRQA